MDFSEKIGMISHGISRRESNMVRIFWYVQKEPEMANPNVIFGVDAVSVMIKLSSFLRTVFIIK